MNPGPILLHVCCAPCATWSILKLQELGYTGITLFYSNSNIYPETEYYKRLEYVQQLAERHSLPLVVDKYAHKEWSSICHPFSAEPEGGKRCDQCFEYTFSKTHALATTLGIAEFTTSLTISPFKNTETIFRIGSGFPGFQRINFKENNGYKKSIELSREYGYYRQKYCGCEYSLSDLKRRSTKKG